MERGKNGGAGERMNHLVITAKAVRKRKLLIRIVS